MSGLLTDILLRISLLEGTEVALPVAYFVPVIRQNVTSRPTSLPGVRVTDERGHRVYGRSGREIDRPPVRAAER